MTLSSRRAVWIVGALLLAFGALKLFASGQPSWTLARVVGELLFIFVTLWLPGFALLSRLMSKQLAEHEIQLLAIPATLAASLLLFVTLHAVSAPVFVYRLCYLGAFAWACVWLVAALRKGLVVALPRSYLFAGWLVLFAACFVCSALNDSPWKSMDWTVAAHRGPDNMPIDNALQWETAQVFISGGEPWAWRGADWAWTMGDRPPLLGAITTVYAKSYLSYRKLRYFDYTLIGMWLNALYVLPTAYLAQRLARSERTALLATLSLAFVPYFFLNTYYTWPKLAGLFFTLTGLSFFMCRPAEDPWTWTRPRGAALLGVLLSLGALCHGGAALSAPLVVLVILATGRDWKPQRVLTGGVVMAAAFAAVNVPWHVYKAQHPSIQSQNLVYHYRAVEGLGEPMSLAKWLEQFPLQKQWEIRSQHVVEMLSNSEFRATFDAYVSGTLDAFYAARWPKEFFWPISQVDEMRWMLGAIAAIALFGAVILAKTSRFGAWPVSTLARSDVLGVVLLLVSAMLCYVLNIFAKWSDLVPHALPIAEVACMVLALALLAYSASRWLGHAVLAAVLLRFLHFQLSASIAHHVPLFGVFGVGCLVSTTMLIWLAFSTPEQAIAQDHKPERSDTISHSRSSVIQRSRALLSRT
jgi:hypothetical protein